MARGIHILAGGRINDPLFYLIAVAAVLLLRLVRHRQLSIRRWSALPAQFRADGCLSGPFLEAQNRHASRPSSLAHVGVDEAATVLENRLQQKPCVSTPSSSKMFL
jgi:hypothetical protein